MLTRDVAGPKPVIGFSTWCRTINIAPYGNFMMEVASTEYLQSAQRQGGAVVMLPHGDPNDIPALIGNLDGLVLIGGDDIDPQLYGQTNEGHSRKTDRRSDEFQIALLSAARERGIPTLAVCRGLQLVNVAAGGTLHQDISGGTLEHLGRDSDGINLPNADHGVSIVDDTCVLSRIYGSHVEVNSIHHQAIADLGTGLTPVAYASDGTVEGIESADASWPMVGVQWHPEKIANGGPLFRWLIESAARFRSKEVTTR